MKEKTIAALKTYAYCYAVTSVLFMLICVVLKRRLNIDISYLRAGVGALIVSVFLTLSAALFRMKKGNAIVKTILGFISLLPAVFVVKRVFGAAVFRYSYIVYLFALLCAVIYSIAVIAVAYRARKDAASLNALIADKKQEPAEEPKHENNRAEADEFLGGADSDIITSGKDSKNADIMDSDSNNN